MAKVDPNVFGALFLHANGADVSEENLKKLYEAIGKSVTDEDKAKISVLVAALKDVNIEEAMEKAVAVPAAAPAAPAPAPAGGEAKEEKKEEKSEEKKEEEAAAGLASLFG